MNVIEYDYHRPVLFRILGGSRAWSLDVEGSDYDYSTYYDSVPPDHSRSQVFPSRSNDLHLLPTQQTLAPDVWLIGDLFSPEIKVAPHFKPYFQRILDLRHRCFMGNPSALYLDLVRKLDLYRTFFDESGNYKYLMYLKFWSDYGRDIFDLGPEACYNRANAEEYRQLRLARELPRVTVQAIYDTAVELTIHRPAGFDRPGDSSIFGEISAIVADYYEEYPMTYGTAE